MYTSIQQQVLKNVIASIGEDNNTSILSYSRLNKAEISVVRKLFEIDAEIQKINQNQIAENWSYAVNSSTLKVSIKAQAEYIQLYMQDLFSEITKKSSFKKN